MVFPFPPWSIFLAALPGERRNLCCPSVNFPLNATDTALGRDSASPWRLCGTGDYKSRRHNLKGSVLSARGPSGNAEYLLPLYLPVRLRPSVSTSAERGLRFSRAVPPRGHDGARCGEGSWAGHTGPLGAGCDGDRGRAPGTVQRETGCEPAGLSAPRLGMPAAASKPRALCCPVQRLRSSLGACSFRAPLPGSPEPILEPLFNAGSSLLNSSLLDVEV